MSDPQVTDRLKPEPPTDDALAANALAQVAAGQLEDAAVTLNALPHDRAIVALLRVGSATARFAAQETGIPVEVLLTTIGADQ